jgi:hypothetical protein
MSNKNDIIHVWEMEELVLTGREQYTNPYTDADVWIDLTGPGFNKRVYGFWDGGKTFRVRFTAPAPGEWEWVSGASVFDTGLTGKSGSFRAAPWSESEKRENPCRRGFLRPSLNGRAFQYADGTPCYYTTDTWWAAPSFRFPWVDKQQKLPGWADMSFQEMVQFRKKQGYSGIAMLAGHPSWAADGRPAALFFDDEEHTPLRHAWQLNGSAGLNDAGHAPAKDMHNEGGRPFMFPGKVPGYEDVVPDFDRINPDYFKYMDRKIAYLNEQGMIPFIETARRDVIPAWKKFYNWPDSYTRYIHYIFSRYQAYNVLLSPIHYDSVKCTVPPREMNEPANLCIDKYGRPPFGTLIGANSYPSSLTDFGGAREARWLTFHQTGNWRTHDCYWYLTEIFRELPARPALNGEPYYPGFPKNNPDASSSTSDRYCRSGMYGSFLSGGLAGYIYGAEGIWGGNIEEEAEYRIWEALRFKSGGQVQYLQKFVMSRGKLYQSLIPEPDLLIPSRTGDPGRYDGWAYCAHTPDKTWALLYFEQGCPKAVIRSLIPEKRYRFSWYNPRNGTWVEPDEPILKTDWIGITPLPDFPDGEDWAASIELAE